MKLSDELRLLDAGIRLTEQRLREFEAQYQIPTAEFISRYEKNQLPETLDLAEWVGEFRLLERKRQKAIASITNTLAARTTSSLRQPPS